MLCPKCNKEMKVIWQEEWKSMDGSFLNSVVTRCDDCDYDHTYDVDDLGREYNHRQFFFG